jgi:hypothetical protein
MTPYIRCLSNEEGNQIVAFSVEKRKSIALGKTGKLKQCIIKTETGKPVLKIVMMETVPIRVIRQKVEIQFIKIAVNRL